MKITRKKSQEEMIGFVLIIVLVAVIGLIFLVISVNQDSEMLESKEVESFLQSSLSYTTSCKISIQNESFQDLIKDCYQNKNCNQTHSCEILNNTAKNLIESSFQISEKTQYKSYEYKILKQNETLILLEKGNKTGIKRGSQISIPVSGQDIKIQFRLYY